MIQADILVAEVGYQNGAFAGDGLEEFKHHLLLAGPGIDEEDVDFIEGDIHFGIARIALMVLPCAKGVPTCVGVSDVRTNCLRYLGSSLFLVDP